MRITDECIQELIINLKNSEVIIRRKTAEELVYIRDGRLIEPLIEALNDPDKEVRELAIDALGNTRDPRAIEPLIRLLSNSDKDIRRMAVWALGCTNNPETVVPLIETANDSESDVRAEVILSLRKLGDLRAIPVLTWLAKEEKGTTPWGFKISNTAKDAITQIRKRQKRNY